MIRLNGIGWLAIHDASSVLARACFLGVVSVSCWRGGERMTDAKWRLLRGCLRSAVKGNDLARSKFDHKWTTGSVRSLRMFCLSSFLRFLSSKVPSMRLFRWSVLNEGQTLSFLWSSDFPSCCRVPVKQDNLSTKYWSIGNSLYLDLVWFGMLTVSAFVQLELAVSVFFFSNDLWNGTRWHVFLRSFSRRDISLWSALGEEQLGVWLNLSQSSLRDSSGEVFSTRDKLSLLTEVRIFFRVVVYRSNKIIWVQNSSIGNFLFWFKMLIVLTAVQLNGVCCIVFLFFLLFRIFCEPVHDNAFCCGRSLNETFHCELRSAKNSLVES